MDSFILDNNKYNLNEEEIASLKVASSFLQEQHYLYAVHELYNTFYINILKRIEFFGLEEILILLKSENKTYYENNLDINKRWQEFTFKDIIKVVKFFKILNKTTLYLFLSFYNFKKNILINDKIQKDELCSFFNLLKNELFLHDYLLYPTKQAVLKRRASDNLKEQRRKEDDENNKKEENLEVNTSTFNKTLSPNNISSYEKEKEDKNKHTTLYI